MKKSVISNILSVINNPQTDYKKIAMEVAKEHPMIFLKCAGFNPEKPAEFAMDALEKEIYGLLKSDLLIDAIKIYRAKTGMGLKEAKDAVEAYRDKWRKEGKLKV
jgi:ribosomal protein L7/L12